MQVPAYLIGRKPDEWHGVQRNGPEGKAGQAKDGDAFRSNLSVLPVGVGDPGEGVFAGQNTYRLHPRRVQILEG
jgi:hypothetical protein